MPGQKKILVTGATGNVGLEVVNFLRAAKAPIVVGVRDIAKAQKVIGDGVEYVEFDFANPRTYEAALRGVKKIFLVRPPMIADVKTFIHPFIDLARVYGVEHIVFLSLLGIEKNKVVPHYKIEQYLIFSGIPYTLLRASFFMQNLNTTHLQDIKEFDEIFLPAGKGKTSFIDVRDIGEVGAKTLLDERHKNKAYTLTGKEALDYYQIAEIFSKSLARKIVYTKPSVCKFYRRMRERGLAYGFIFIMIALYSIAKLGLAKKTTGELEELLGREPITVAKYVEDYKECWI